MLLSRSGQRGPGEATWYCEGTPFISERVIARPATSRLAHCTPGWLLAGRAVQKEIGKVGGLDCLRQTFSPRVDQLPARCPLLRERPVQLPSGCSQIFCDVPSG